jgi:uncharacterized protein YgbK (DUF1537 family)
MSLLLGCVADDVTGATDLSLMLARHGMSVVQILGQPESGLPPDPDPDPGVDAVVVALKTRTAPASDAVSESLAAASWLRKNDARQLYFKYCSTFDSTDEGNIGPVGEALLDFVGADFAVVCPSFPDNQRTVYQGHLFVGGELLSESGMRHHPLTPMTDSNLVRVLDRQCRGRGSVGLIDYAAVEKGVDAIRDRCDELKRSGRRFGVVDALTNRHLLSIARACHDSPLVTGGSALAMGLPENFRRAGLLPERDGPAKLPRLTGPAAVISGSCSTATRVQVEEMKSRFPSFALDPIALAEGRQSTDELITKAVKALEQRAVLIYSTSPPEVVERAQKQLGKLRAGEQIERVLASVAVALVRAGVRKLIVAGGETSGAVASALGVRRLRIGPEIDPGVPWTIHLDSPELLLAFKSGNFGSSGFFTKALEVLP